MIGYKVLTTSGLRGPFKKSSLMKAITSAMVPLQARVLELETNRYLSAAELVGEEISPAAVAVAEPPKPADGEPPILAEPPKPAAPHRPPVNTSAADSLSAELEADLGIVPEDRTIAMSPDEIIAATKDKLQAVPKTELKLDEETPGETDPPRVILKNKIPLKSDIKLPKPRKLRRDEGELELNYPAA